MKHFWLVFDILGGVLFSFLIAAISFCLTLQEECMTAKKRWRG